MNSDIENNNQQNRTINVIETIGKILTSIFMIFNRCRCNFNLCKSSCVIGDEQEMEQEDIEIHRVKKIVKDTVEQVTEV